jgi:hypothetical protein
MKQKEITTENYGLVFFKMLSFQEKQKGDASKRAYSNNTA